MNVTKTQQMIAANVIKDWLNDRNDNNTVNPKLLARIQNIEMRLRK